MEQMQKKTRQVQIAQSEINLVSDFLPSEGLLDTRVDINDAMLCWISGNRIDEFLNDFRSLVEKYQI